MNESSEAVPFFNLSRLPYSFGRFNVQKFRGIKASSTTCYLLRNASQLYELPLLWQIASTREMGGCYLQVDNTPPLSLTIFTTTCGLLSSSLTSRSLKAILFVLLIIPPLPYIPVILPTHNLPPRGRSPSYFVGRLGPPTVAS